VRDPSISAGLDASTFMPGITVPELPLTCPEIALCVSTREEARQMIEPTADFHGNDHRFQLKAINDFILGDHARSEATLAF
jgi:hypothetical protein